MPRPLKKRFQIPLALQCLVSLGDKDMPKILSLWLHYQRYYCVDMRRHECTWNLHIETLTLIAEEKIEDEIMQLGILRESTEIPSPSSDSSEKWQDISLEKVGQTCT